MKKQKKKRRLKVGRLILLLFVIALISFALYDFVDVPINSILIKGNNILTDEEIIKQANLDDYPSYFATLSFMVEKKLKENPYVKKVKVKKGILSINIKITEKKVLYIEKDSLKKVTYDSKIKDDKIVCAPYLTSEIPKEKMGNFIKKMNTINKDILCQMSEIKYDPNDIDDDRYFVYMNDGNSVYLTVNKLNKINKYNTILENIGKQSGTLFLDYGDYFESK